MRLFWVGPTAVWLAGDSLWAVIPTVILIASVLAAAWRYWGASGPDRALTAPAHPIIFPLFASSLILSAIVAALLSQYKAAICFAAIATSFTSALYFQATDPLDPAADPPFESHPNNLARFSDYRAGATAAIHTQPEPGRIGAGVPIRNVDFSHPQIVRS